MPSHEDMARVSAQFRVAVPLRSSSSPSKVVQSVTKSSKGAVNPVTATLVAVQVVWAVPGTGQPRTSRTTLAQSSTPAHLPGPAPRGGPPGRTAGGRAPDPSGENAAGETGARPIFETTGRHTRGTRG